MQDNKTYSKGFARDLNLKLYIRATATGYRGLYKEGKVYYGYPTFNIVKNRFDLTFEDECGWNCVDIDQDSIQRYIATDNNGNYVFEGDTLIVTGYIDDEGEVIGFRDTVKCTAIFSNIDDIERGVAFKDVKGAEQVKLNIA